ncbi:MAG: hypothetical protein JWM34_1540 [Ilumatobacteraceae bacterium]|nr:hypothetical protein [Ilumatobacteraceae bacterium]
MGAFGGDECVAGHLDMIEASRCTARWARDVVEDDVRETPAHPGCSPLTRSPQMICRATIETTDVVALMQQMGILGP